jgi:hypothetical protein
LDLESRQARSRFAQSSATAVFQWTRILLPVADSNSTTHSGLATVAGADQFDEPRLALCLRPPRFGSYEEPLQFTGIQTQLLGGTVDAMLPGGIDRELP